MKRKLLIVHLLPNILLTANTNSQPKKKAATNADKKNLKPIPGVTMKPLSNFFTKK